MSGKVVRKITLFGDVLAIIYWLLLYMNSFSTEILLILFGRKNMEFGCRESILLMTFFRINRYTIFLQTAPAFDDYFITFCFNLPGITILIRYLSNCIIEIVKSMGIFSLP